MTGASGAFWGVAQALNPMHNNVINLRPLPGVDRLPFPGVPLCL